MATYSGDIDASHEIMYSKYHSVGQLISSINKN